MKLVGRWPLVTLSGFLVILLYCGFTFTSWALYPFEYGPLTHYLSRLGNFDYSPFGAYFYNWGCILTGIALIPFFIGLYVWHPEKRIGKGILIIGQIIGLAAAVALIMIGIFSENLGQPHMTASTVFFELNFVLLILMTIGLLFNPDFNKGIALYGLIIDFSTLYFAFTSGGPLLEWYTVFGSLIFVGLLSLNSLKLNGLK